MPHTKQLQHTSLSPVQKRNLTEYHNTGKIKLRSSSQNRPTLTRTNPAKHNCETTAQKSETNRKHLQNVRQIINNKLKHKIQSAQKYSKLWKLLTQKMNAEINHTVCSKLQREDKKLAVKKSQRYRDKLSLSQAYDSKKQKLKWLTWSQNSSLKKCSTTPNTSGQAISQCSRAPN